MKQLFKIASLLIALELISAKSFSQVISPENEESYCKANIAYTDFQLLGVTSVLYAKCVKAVNFLDPGKTGKRVTINGTDFVDDGLNNDLAANDGILTATVLSRYSGDMMPLPPRVYQNVNNQAAIYDHSFVHVNKLNEKTGSKTIELEKSLPLCIIVWVRCSSWPTNIQSLCYSTSWPFNGYINIVGCVTGFF